MNKTIFALCITLTFAATNLSQSTTASISELTWLAGCWQVKDSKPGAVISEQWMLPLGNAMIGAGRTVKNGRMTEFEFLRIVQKDGTLFYIARPAENTAETPFGLIRSANDEYVFENKDHDFPQRVIYRKEKDGSLFARVEGTSNGKLFGIDYLSNRVRCER
jgi:hypothetical protein